MKDKTLKWDLEWSLSEEEFYNLLDREVNFKVSDSYWRNESSVYSRINKELEYIKKYKWAKHFMYAYKISEIISCINQNYGERDCFYGSAISSVVAFVLGITSYNIDPIKNDLIFESMFNNNMTSNRFFGYCLFEEDFDKLKEILHKEDICFAVRDSDKFSYDNVTLQIGDFNFSIYPTIKDIKNYYHFEYNRINRNEETTLFMEGYMKLLRYSTGCSYEEASVFINKSCENLCGICEIESLKQNFLEKCLPTLEPTEKEKLFYEITKQCNTRSHQKGLYLAEKLMLGYIKERKQENTIKD